MTREKMAADWSAMDDKTIIDWQPIATFPKGTKWALAYSVLCCHETDRWIRFGRHYGELDRWYYSGTNERSQYSETVGGEPTHWAPMPALPTPPLPTRERTA